jgi:hypothetical protein
MKGYRGERVGVICPDPLFLGSVPVAAEKACLVPGGHTNDYKSTNYIMSLNTPDEYWGDVASKEIEATIKKRT